MERNKNLNSSVEERQETIKVKAEKNTKSLEIKNVNVSNLDLAFQPKAKNSKPSMIPIIKTEKIETKTMHCKKRPVFSSKPLSANKLKVVREKESSAEEIIQKSKKEAQKRGSGSRKSFKRKTYEDTAARKMTSDPLVFGKSRIKIDISDFENNIQQISHIWLKTTADLSSTLRNLKNNLSVDPIQLQMESTRIQLAIKQAKSLTLVKTRSVIAEAKKLFRNREIIRTELERLLSQDNSRTEPFECQKAVLEKQKRFNHQNTKEKELKGTGDSVKRGGAESLEGEKEITGDQHGQEERLERIEKESLMHKKAKLIKENSFSDEKIIISEESSKKQIKLDNSYYNPEKIIAEMEILKDELFKKNNTIMNLNKKIFDLQKTCNENSVKYNQLQVKLFEFNEKIQWNQVLWKQMAKLKERIKELEQSNKELEFRKKDLEFKISKREQEINKLMSLNNFLNQKKHFLNTQGVSVSKCRGGEFKPRELQCETIHEECFNKINVNENIIEEKQTVINQLRKVLTAMKDQEDFAQKQIFLFQSRIEELEKNGKI